MKNRTLDKDSRMAVDCINDLVRKIEELEETIEETIEERNERIEILEIRNDDLNDIIKDLRSQLEAS